MQGFASVLNMKDRCRTFIMKGVLQCSSQPANVFPSTFWPGILHKGSGENIFVTEQPPVITSVMGNGRRRSISCPSCNGLADGNKLLAPVALAMGIDGSLYVGDLNFVRRVYPSMNTTGILELR